MKKKLFTLLAISFLLSYCTDKKTAQEKEAAVELNQQIETIEHEAEQTTQALESLDNEAKEIENALDNLDNL